MGCVYGAKHQQTELYFVKIAKKETKKEKWKIYKFWHFDMFLSFLAYKVSKQKVSSENSKQSSWRHFYIYISRQKQVSKCQSIAFTL